MKTLKLFILCFACLSFTSHAQDEDLVGYDSIIKELNSSTYSRKPSRAGMGLGDIMLHSGVGITTSYITIKPEEGNHLVGLLRGVEFNFGIDLFSDEWLAEVAVRSYQPEDIAENTQISMREFDLKLTYQSFIARSLKGRFAAGMAARYLNFRSREPGEVLRNRYSTPASVLSTGLQFAINRTISLGSDVSYRTALIEDSVDRSSFDASLRVDAEF